VDPLSRREAADEPRRCEAPQRKGAQRHDGSPVVQKDLGAGGEEERPEPSEQRPPPPAPDPRRDVRLLSDRPTVKVRRAIFGSALVGAANADIEPGDS
jgi:hypothetical protein